MQPNYDFGMRALKSILLSAGTKLRDCSTQGVRSDTLLSEPVVDLKLGDAKELSLFIHALHDMILPKLTTADSLVVQGLIQVCILASSLLS